MTKNFIQISPNTSPISVLQTQTQAISSLYGTFNLGLHVKDDPQQVHHNRATLLQIFQRQHPHIQQIHWLNQVHGDRVVDIDTLPLATQAVSADAHITASKNVALAIMTADCVPIMLSSGDSESGEVIAGIHAGWQGLAKGIIAKTVTAMQEKIAVQNTENWQAWVGACIAREHYEVDEKVRSQVLTRLETQLAEKNHTLNEQDKARLFTPQPQKAGHYLADLPAITQFQLQLCGLKPENIHLSGLDSYDDKRFYSYRQQTDNALAFTGRMATLIFKN